MKLYSKIGKNVVDKFFAVIILCLSLPLFIIVISLLFFYGYKIFFVQQRPGKEGKSFSLIKFKTMNDKKDNNGNLLPDEDRLTWAGKIMRKLSIDELPQLINVIKGDMSLIGPRPLLIEYLPLYNDYQKRRHEVKPGITGWAQVNGRNAITWKEKFEMDVWYVDNVSFKLDLKIFFLTIVKIFKREGISTLGHATAPKFNGSN